jgi:hypothetical protein
MSLPVENDESRGPMDVRLVRATTEMAASYYRVTQPIQETAASKLPLTSSLIALILFDLHAAYFVLRRQITRPDRYCV